MSNYIGATCAVSKDFHTLLFLDFAGRKEHAILGPIFFIFMQFSGKKLAKV